MPSDQVTQTISTYAGVTRILSDPAYTVPEPAAKSTSPMDQLRSAVSRFCNGPAHTRRRARIEQALSALSPATLQEAAKTLTADIVRHHRGRPLDVEDLSRTVPLSVLGGALGVAAADLPELVRTTREIAAAYHPGTGEADAAVGELVALLPAADAETTTSHVCLLVQACDSTAGLIRNAYQAKDKSSDTYTLLTDTLRLNPPIRATRRQAPDGRIVILDLAAANLDPAAENTPHLTFGHGVRPCPGSAHALALAAGVLNALPNTEPNTEEVTP